MTTTVETAAATGRVARVIGPVVDVEFPVDAMPAIYNALHVEVADPANAGELKTLTGGLRGSEHDARRSRLVSTVVMGRSSALELTQRRTC